ncbi:MAG: hypothetical protein ACRDRS_09950 [Pseudonocardiaceae bacterium]
MDRSRGHVRADVVHERLVAVGFDGDERTTRRAVAEVKARWRAGHRLHPQPSRHVTYTLRSAETCRQERLPAGQGILDHPLSVHRIVTGVNTAETNTVHSFW